MVVSPEVVKHNPRFFNVLEKLHCTTREGKDVKMNAGTVVAVATLVFTLLGSVYGLVIVPLKGDIQRLEIQHAEDIKDHEIRITAGEISDGRTGVHLQELTKSIDRLIDRMEVN